MENVQFLQTQGDYINQLIIEKWGHSWEKTFFNYFQLLKLNHSITDTEHCEEKQASPSPGTCCGLIEITLNIHFKERRWENDRFVYRIPQPEEIAVDPKYGSTGADIQLFPGTLEIIIPL